MTAERPKRVLLIGWDAADWKVAAPMMDAGEMPNLAKLVSGGVMGNMATLYPVLSPMLWTSIATGKRAHKHGIHGFSEPDPASGGVRPITNLSRKVKAVWNILNQNGLKSNVVGWWPSNPAEPIDGVMVSNLYQAASFRKDGTWPMRPGTVHPPRLIEPLKEFRIAPNEIEGEQILPFVPRAAEIDQDKDKRLVSIAKILAETASVHAAATAIMQLEPWDFMAVYFDGIDHFCHGFMRYHPPRQEWVDERDFELYSGVIKAAYQFHDLMLGVYMHLVPEDTAIMLISDHGFHPDHLRPQHISNEPAGPADEHRQFGVFALNGPGIKQDEMVFGASLVDVAPTILQLFGLPTGLDMDGRPLIGAWQTPPVVDYIESWEQMSGKDGRHPLDAQITVDPVDQQEAIAQLVELGYIERPDENREKAIANTVRELRYNLARDYIGCRLYSQAVEILEELWQKFPDESRFGVKLVECHIALGQAGAAREALDRVRQEKQRYAAEARDKLQALHAEDKEKERKPEDLPEADRRERRNLMLRAGVNPHAFAYLEGRVSAAEGDNEKALQAYERAAEVQVANRPSLYQAQGDTLLRLRRWAQAEERFRAILEIDPINAGAQFGLARAHFGRGQDAEARQAALAAVGLIYQNPLAHYLLARIAYRLGERDEAHAALDRALGQNPVFPDAYLLRARLHQQAGEPDAARNARKLARASRKRIRDARAGLERPTDRDVELDVLLQSAASVGRIGEVLGKPPLDSDEVVIVSGLPRSGTSMMMQLLEAGGVPVLTDGERAADSDNPRGYYEFEQAKARGDHRGWLTDAGGKAVKMVVQLLPNLPPDRKYRVIFMERPLGEVLASQDAMLERLDRPRLGRRSNLARTYQSQIEQVKRVLADHEGRIAVLPVDYRRALAEPQSVAAEVSAFLGGTLDVEKAAGAVDPSLRRQGAPGSNRPSEAAA
jgi:predicted AlkP superfamily phosphohydrolase/phosphomutase/tetratricopeptide (TPR) repeat protein